MGRKAVVQVRVASLTPHAANAAIYGQDESIDDLVESIAASGVREPLAVTRSHVIISGHRRWRAARQLGMKTVPAIIIDGLRDGQGEIEALLLYNQQRVKTNESRIREALRWFEIETARARERQRRRPRGQSVRASLPEQNGRTRDLVAQRVGIGCGRNVEKGVRAVELLDSLLAEGLTVEAEGVRRELNRSYHAGHRVARRHARDPQLTLRLLRLVGSGQAGDIDHAREVSVLQARRRVPRTLPKHSDRYDIYHGDLLAVGRKIRSKLRGAAGLTIISDPPYTAAPYGGPGADTVRDAYRKLADFAAEYLPEGGSLFAMAGIHHLPAIFGQLRARPELTYYWTLCVHQPGRSSKQRWRVVNTNWKPVLWFVKGKASAHEGKKINDVIRNSPIAKTEHPWQQSEVPFEFLIREMTRPGGMVVDPFMGAAATTGLAALKLGRRFVGIEVQRDIYHQAAKRLDEAAKELVMT